ncbi:adenosine kinase [Bauldia sp.]|uniref:adenosine kinase n=1 Tax=Bauldia sp. TaxID=2575872 RepID=UPI003BAB20CD
MNPPRFDALCIGNAIVDVLSRTEDDFLLAQDLHKGTMHLIDEARAKSLYDAMGPAIEASGGSAGNTAAGIASLGGNAAFFGKVADDTFGGIYAHDMHAIGVHFETPRLTGGLATASSMILITPDGERTMNTYLGAAQLLSPDDIDPAVVSAAAITYMEGYLWDPPLAKEAFRHAATIAHEAGRQVSLTLSDPFCVDRFRAEFLGLIRDGTVDILFANDSELRSLYETANLDAALRALAADCPLAAVTVGVNGAIVVSGDGVSRVDATPVENVADLTGAGDLFASGFLFGIARDMDPIDAARLGTLAAAEVIGHIGPRPVTSLRDLAREAGFDI